MGIKPLFENRQSRMAENEPDQFVMIGTTSQTIDECSHLKYSSGELSSWNFLRYLLRHKCCASRGNSNENAIKFSLHRTVGKEKACHRTAVSHLLARLIYDSYGYPLFAWTASLIGQDVRKASSNYTRRSTGTTYTITPAERASSVQHREN
ncbi:hypothetical protein GYMLUDRAFT_60541 [Collybiopsis luxurians FD-317 M1]|uniref:Uncharacterized protein n=1 Tax=Collybiopsis luxurians FD-317 M1 TaxID=944289 RepID=A0A0D0CK40_9AGAR|nr:hypothetical protein GYMLUDRAFT_60541 [Collybiopsis luxurians FD-317 M1]